ncbi:MAG: hypothetical protein ED559_08975 [Phycisphaera sp.]|nr:MAG: hypothetical protein ED559_08975 [Phycisphaera sp.]
MIPIRLNATITKMMPDRRGHAGNRRATRYRFQFGQRFKIKLHRASDVVVADAIVRDVSSEGIGIWLRAIVHPGTSCTITIDLDNTVDGSIVELNGEIVWCTHFSHSIHEAGITVSKSDRYFLQDQIQDRPATLETVSQEDAAARAQLLRIIERQLPENVDVEKRDRLLQAVRDCLNKCYNRCLVHDYGKLARYICARPEIESVCVKANYMQLMLIRVILHTWKERAHLRELIGYTIRLKRLQSPLCPLSGRTTHYSLQLWQAKRLFDYPHTAPLGKVMSSLCTLSSLRCGVC